MSQSLDVVIPCYNPPDGWEGEVARKFLAFRAFVADLGEDVRLIVVNDGSPRNVSTENIERLKKHLPDVLVVNYTQNRGKGYALRQGVMASTADLILVTDTDFPYTLASMKRIVECLKTRGGIAAGNRDMGYYDHVPAFRRWLSKALRWVLRYVLRQPVDDSQCGLKGFDQAGKAIFLETTIDRFLFDLEFLMLAHGRVGVNPVNVQLTEGIVFSKVGLRILFTEGRNFLTLILKNMLSKAGR
jgi:glycosyltransferase involved in cell wall biosynthesis